MTELAAIIPESSRLDELENTIERARAGGHGRGEERAGRHREGAGGRRPRRPRLPGIASVEAARAYVTELAGVTPRSRRVTELEGKIDRAELIPAMVRIRGGELKMKMGGNGKFRRIAAKGFWFGKYEVTFDEYDRFAAETRRRNRTTRAGAAGAVRSST